MKLFKLSSLLICLLALALAGTGCKRKTPGVTNLPNTPNSGLSGGDLGSGGRMPGDAVPIGGGDLATFDPDSMQQDRAALAAHTVYFDLDSSALKPSEQSKIEAVASALRSDASAKLLIEGHCDERGTEEYNRSLGERRALAAREALAILGIDAARIATRSYGEDRPSDVGHDEVAWQKNRRDEFVLLH